MNAFEGEEINYVSNIFYNLEEYKDLNETVSELIRNIKTEKIKKQMMDEKDPEIISGLIKKMTELTSGNN